MVQHYQPHGPYPLPSPPRLPLQPSPYQNEARAAQLPPPVPPPAVAYPDAYSMWERKVYTSLQPSRPPPYPVEVHRPSRLPAVYNPVPQPPSLSPGLSGGNSVEYASCSTSGTPCDFHHNDQFTPPAQSEAVHPIVYRRSPPQLPMPSNSGEPVFPPPLEASRFPPAQAPPPPNQAFPSSPMGLAQRRPSNMPLQPFYPQPSLCNGRGAGGGCGGATAGGGAPAFMEPNFDGIQPTPMMPPQGSSGQLDGPRRKNATRQATAYLKKWLSEHSTNPYPTKNEKIMLAFITKMSFNQISTWFANARRRLKKENKMTWSPKTGSTESRPRVPELVRGEGEESSEGRVSSRLETVSECDQPLGHGQPEDPFAAEEVFSLAFTGGDVRPPLPPAAVFPHPPSAGEGATAFVYGSGHDEAMFCHARDYFTNSTEDEGGHRSHLTSIH